VVERLNDFVWLGGFSRSETPTLDYGLAPTDVAHHQAPHPDALCASGLCVPSMGDDLEVKVLWNN
jgi:hypothetical protein